MTAHPEGTQGASGEPITRDATGEEVYSTLYTIRESPIQRGLIWTGSNDGPVWVTRDNGKTWTDVTPKDMPKGGRIQNIEPSPHRPGTAYFAGYRYLLGDFSPYIYRTDDFGKTWTKLTDGKNGIAADEPTRVVREDPARAGLLYAGTEFGMYISFDNGAHWQSFQLNLPHTPVTDIKLAHNDLIMSTQGRGFWILDNLGPLHQIKETSAGDSAILFTPRDAVRSGRRSEAMLEYYIGATPNADLKLEILDAKGQVARTYMGTPQEERPVVVDDEEGGGGRGRAPVVRLDKGPGFHRVTWDLRYSGAGPLAVPGKYNVRLTSGAWTNTQPLTVIEDPRIEVSQADLQEQFDHNSKVHDLLTEVNELIAKIRAVKDPAKKDEIETLAGHLITPSIRYSKPELQTEIQYLYQMTNGADEKIGNDAKERYNTLRKELDQRKAELDRILR